MDVNHFPKEGSQIPSCTQRQSRSRKDEKPLKKKTQTLKKKGSELVYHNEHFSAKETAYIFQGNIK